MLLKIPFSIEDAYGTKGRLKVRGRLNGTAFQTSLFPGGDGSHHMLVNKALQAAAGAGAGSIATVTIAPDRAPAVVPVPADLKAALAADPNADKRFAQLAPSRRKYLVQGIEGAKRAETRARRITATLRKLKTGRH